MKCKMELKLNAYLDKELNKNEHEIIRKHLETCSFCQQSLRELMQINEILNQYEEKDVPEHVMNAIFEKVRVQPQIASRQIINFGVAAAILFSFFSGLWFSSKVIAPSASDEQFVEIGTESLYSYLNWEE